MKIVFGSLQDFIFEMKESEQKEVRLIQMVNQKSDKYGIMWVTIYSLLTAEIARGTIAELRIVHGTTTQPIALADEDKRYRDLVTKANEKHKAIEERLREAGLVVRKGAYRPDSEVVDGDIE